MPIVRRSFALITIVCLVFSVTVRAELCDELLVPTDGEIVALVRQETSAHSLSLLAAKMSHVVSGRFSVEDKVALIVDLIKTNYYLEQVLPSYGITNMAQDFVAKKSSPQAMVSHIIDTIVVRRRSYYQGLASIQSGIEDMAQRTKALERQLTLVTHNSRYILYTLDRSLGTRELFALLPIVNNLWPRSFHFQQGAPARVIRVELSQMPGVYVYIFAEMVGMNAAFQRVSRYIEQKEWPIRGVDIYGNVAGGHDLKGSDILRYYTAQQSVWSEDIKSSNDKNYRWRLELENEFLRSEIVPMIRKTNAETVYLAVSTGHGIVSTTTHEVWHGLYFTNAKYAEFSRAYWKRLSEKDKNSFKEVAGGYGYDITDEELMANEFQAFMLEKDAIMAPTPQVLKQQKMNSELRPAFMEAFNKTEFAR